MMMLVISYELPESIKILLVIIYDIAMHSLSHKLYFISDLVELPTKIFIDRHNQTLQKTNQITHIQL